MSIVSLFGERMKYIINNSKKKTMKFKGKAKQLLEKLGISEQIVIIKRNGEIITELDDINDNDMVEIQKVILGG
jgi:sulfur carrier protein ThiS